MKIIKHPILGFVGLLGFLILATAGVGCGTTLTTINTTPADATVYVNGAKICAKTPCYWGETIGLAHRSHLQIRRAGYKEVNLYVDKEIMVWMRVATLLSRVLYYSAPVGPIVDPFTYRLPKDMAFQMEPADGAAPPPPVAPPPGPPPVYSPPPPAAPPAAAAPAPAAPPPGPPVFKPAPPAAPH